MATEGTCVESGVPYPGLCCPVGRVPLCYRVFCTDSMYSTPASTHQMSAAPTPVLTTTNVSRHFQMSFGGKVNPPSPGVSLLLTESGALFSPGALEKGLPRLTKGDRVVLGNDNSQGAVCYFTQCSASPSAKPGRQRGRSGHLWD